jgi:hypothetical protein
MSYDMIEGHLLQDIKVETVWSKLFPSKRPILAQLFPCSETTLTGESRFHISTPQGICTWVPCDRKQTGSPLGQWDMVRMKWDCRLSTGLPPSSRLRQLCSRKGDLQRAWNRDRKAVWDQVGSSHCRHEGLVTVRDEARLRRGHNDDQSRQGHQCSETTLTGESRFHISTPQGIWTQVPCDGKQTGSPLGQWDMVRMKWDFRLSTPQYLTNTQCHFSCSANTHSFTSHIWWIQTLSSFVSATKDKVQLVSSRLPFPSHHSFLPPFPPSVPTLPSHRPFSLNILCHLVPPNFSSWLLYFFLYWTNLKVFLPQIFYPSLAFFWQS